MNVQLAPSAGPSLETFHARLKNFVEEMAPLLESAPSAEAFYREYLDKVLATTEAAGGALWLRTERGDWSIQCQTNVQALELAQDASGSIVHQRLLHQAGERDRAFWVAPRQGSSETSAAAVNPTPFALLFSQIPVDKQVVGLIELWFAVAPEQAQRRALCRLLMEMATVAAAYLHKHQWQSLVERERFLAQLDAFTRQVHGSLHVTEVAYQVANDCRRILGCDQASVVARHGRTTKVQAISGAPGFDKQSNLVGAMQSLTSAVLAWGEKLIFQGSRVDDLPLQVQEPLNKYLSESNGRLLFVLPLRDPRDQDRPCAFGLVLESFGAGADVAQVERGLDLLLPHVRSALYNADEFRRLPLRSLGLWVGRARDAIGARKFGKAGLILALAAIVLGLLVFVQAPYRQEAKGQLVPQQRQLVFAPLAGKIVELKVQAGDLVEQGQELLFLEDLETQLQIDQLGVKIAAAEQRLAFLGEQLGKAFTPEERLSLTKDRFTQEYELRKAIAERDIIFQASRNPRKAPLASPLAGKVLTFDAHEQLVGKTVKPGDPLLRIAAIKGTWEIELYFPEAAVQSIREGFEHAPGAELDIDVLLASQPQRTYKAKLQRNGLGGETIIKDNKVVLPARARIADPELAAQLSQHPVGVEVRAKVHCGHRALGYVWFAEVWDFLYESFLF